MDTLSLSTIPWVFSGIGCVIFTFLIQFGYQKWKTRKRKENTLKTGDSQNISLSKSQGNTISQIINKK
jgi:threonine/homoserine/homoserine lactone efflux protein